jgi:hypothetical protein
VQLTYETASDSSHYRMRHVSRLAAASHRMIFYMVSNANV